MKFFRTLSETEIATIGPEIGRFRLIAYGFYVLLAITTSVLLHKSLIVFFGSSGIFGPGLINGFVALLFYSIFPVGAMEHIYGLFRGWPLGVYPRSSLFASWWVDRFSVVGILLTLLATPVLGWLLVVLTGLLFGYNLWPSMIHL